MIPLETLGRRLLEVCRDPRLSGPDQLAAAYALTVHRVDGVGGLLREWVATREASIREDAVLLLGVLQDARDHALLRALLERDPVPEVRASAAFALGMLPDAETPLATLTVLAERALQDPDPWVTASAYDAFSARLGLEALELTGEVGADEPGLESVVASYVSLVEATEDAEGASASRGDWAPHPAHAARVSDPTLVVESEWLIASIKRRAVEPADLGR